MVLFWIIILNLLFFFRFILLLKNLYNLYPHIAIYSRYNYKEIISSVKVYKFTGEKRKILNFTKNKVFIFKLGIVYISFDVIPIIFVFFFCIYISLKNSKQEKPPIKPFEFLFFFSYFQYPNGRVHLS